MPVVSSRPASTERSVTVIKRLLCDEVACGADGRLRYVAAEPGLRDNDAREPVDPDGVGGLLVGVGGAQGGRFPGGDELRSGLAAVGDGLLMELGNAVAVLGEVGQLRDGGRHAGPRFGAVEQSLAACK